MIGQRDSKFYSELKQMNEDLVNYLKLSHDKSPYFDFSPTLKDYIKQFSDLEKQYPINGGDKTTTNTSSSLGPSPPKLGAGQNSMSSFVSAAPFVPSSFAPLSSSSSSTSTFPTKIPQISTNNNSLSSNNTLAGSNNLFSIPPAAATTTTTSSSSSSLSSSTASALPTFMNPITTPAAGAAAAASSTSSLFSSSLATTTTAAATTIGGVTSNSQPPATTQPFLFGQALNTSSSLTGSSSQPGATSNTSFFSFTMPPAPRKDEAAVNNKDATDNAAGEEDVLPPEPKIDKYEEPDAKHSVKCKLYEKVKGSGSEVNVNLLGIGTLFVKPLDTPTKFQVIVRQEPDLRRVLLNEVVTNNIPVKLLPKAIQMVFPSAGADNKFIIVKVRDENEANTLYEMLNFSKS